MNAAGIHALNKAQIFRLIWIDAYVSAIVTGLRRADLCLAFGISQPQASTDLGRFQLLFPDRIKYDSTKKAYFRSTTSSPIFDRESHVAILSACHAATAASLLINSRCKSLIGCPGHN